MNIIKYRRFFFEKDENKIKFYCNYEVSIIIIFVIMFNVLMIIQSFIDDILTRNIRDPSIILLHIIFLI